jgi:hypothetical protein
LFRLLTLSPAVRPAGQEDEEMADTTAAVCCQCGKSALWPVTWSNVSGRQERFCDNDCLRLWLEVLGATARQALSDPPPQYQPQHTHPKASACWFGPGFRESDAWHRLRRDGANPPRSILPGELFDLLPGGKPVVEGKNILSYPTVASACQALTVAQARLAEQTPRKDGVA